MRIYKVRYDILICMILAGVMAFGVGKMLPGVYSALYSNYARTHTAAAGDIGGEAGEDVHRAKDVDDLLSHDMFTVESSYGAFVTADSGYFEGIYLLNLELPSGQRVAACINQDGTQKDDDTYLMPVGRVVYADLSADSKFLGYIEKTDPLTRKDFYLDMEGNGSAAYNSPDTYDQKYTIYVKAATAVASFAVFHMAGSKLGLFPCFFRRRKEK